MSHSPDNMLRTRNSSASAGFTLLELVVSLALTSLLALIAYTSISLSIKVVYRGQAAADHLQEIRVGQTILSRSLSSAVRTSFGVRSSSGDNRFYFLGDTKQIRFFTLVPLEAHNLGGIYHMRVLVGRDEDDQLVLAVEQAKNVNWQRDPEGVELRQIILGNLISARFAYVRGDQEVETWDANRDGGLPDWVRVYLAQPGHDPQSWLIPIHVSEYKFERRTP